MTHQGQLLTKFSKLAGSRDVGHLSGYEGQVRLAGRVVGSQESAGNVCQWATPSRDIGSPCKLCEDLYVPRRSQYELCCIFPSVHPTVMYLRGKMTLVKLLLHYSFSV